MVQLCQPPNGTGKPRHVLKISDLSKSEVTNILEHAEVLKSDRYQKSAIAEQKTLLMLFEKPSLRTRVSFETGMHQLGGHAIYYDLGGPGSTIGSKETISDSAHVTSRYCDIIMARLKDRNVLAEFAKYSSVPVINALDDFAHPCQILADLLTIKERLGTFEGMKLAFVGDIANNVTYDLMRAGAMLGFEVNVCGPDPEKEGYEFAVEHAVLEEIKDLESKQSRSFVNVVKTAKEAFADADVVYTDTWMSYHLSPSERDRRFATLKDFQVTSELMRLAKPSCIFMHCLPVERGVEVTEDVIDGKQSVVFDQAENRMHAQKALLLFLLQQSTRE